MQKNALKYYKQGYNCSQCILKAAEQTYKIPISKQSMNMCLVVNSGFGIGGVCSVLIGGVMVFGLMFDENTAKSLRINLFNTFREKYPSLNCSQLTKDDGKGKGCEELVSNIALMVEVLIDKQLK